MSTLTFRIEEVSPLWHVMKNSTWGGDNSVLIWIILCAWIFISMSLLLHPVHIFRMNRVFNQIIQSRKLILPKLWISADLSTGVIDPQHIITNIPLSHKILCAARESLKPLHGHGLLRYVIDRIHECIPPITDTFSLNIRLTLSIVRGDQLLYKFKSNLQILKVWSYSDVVFHSSAWRIIIDLHHRLVQHFPPFRYTNNIKGRLYNVLGRRLTTGKQCISLLYLIMPVI